MSFSKQITIENIFLLQGMNSEAARRLPQIPTLVLWCNISKNYKAGGVHEPTTMTTKISLSSLKWNE
jgi:hypothetical protein